MTTLSDKQAQLSSTASPGGDWPPGSATPVVEAATREALRGMFARDSLYMVLWGVQLAIFAVCVPITTRLLGPVGFGRLASAIAVMQILVALGSFSLQAAVQRLYADPDGERNARRVVSLAILLATASFALAAETGPLWCHALGLGTYGPTIQHAVAWAALTAISNAALGLIRSRDQLFAFGIVTVLQSVVAEVLSLLLVLLVRRTASEFVLGEMIAQGATVVVALLVVRPLALRRRDLSMLRQALRYSGGLVPAALATFVLDASDRLIIRHDLGSSAVARYAVAYNIANLTIVLLGVLATVWMPRIFSLADERVRASVLTASRNVVYALLIPAVLGVTAASPILLKIWAPPSYRPAGLLLIVAIVAVTAFPYAGMLAAGRVLMLAKSTLTVGIATVIAGLGNIGMNLLLVPRLGITGAGLSTFLAYGLLFALQASRARRVIRLPAPPKILVTKVAAAVTVSILSSQLPSSSILTAARVFVAIACLVLFAAMLSNMLTPSRSAVARRIAAVVHPTDVAILT